MTDNTTHTHASFTSDAIAADFSDALSYRAFADALPEIIWIADAQGQPVFYNKRWYDYTGLPAAPDSATQAWEPIHPDDRAGAIARWNRAVAAQDAELRDEFRLRGADGVYRWFFAHGFAQKDPATGATLRWLGSSTDIDDMKRAQKASGYSEERYRALVDASSQVVWTNTASGEMRGAQPGWAKLTGQTQAEYEGYGWSSAVHPGDAKPTIDAWQQSLYTRTPFLFEHRVRRHDGAWRLFTIRAVPIMDGDNAAGALAGETIREWVGIHTDITEARAAQIQQKQTLEQLKAILDSAMEGIVVADGAGNVLMMNPAALALHGFASNNDSQRPLTQYENQFRLCNPQGEPLPLSEWPLARGLRGENLTDYECRVQRHGTPSQWYASYSVSPVRDENGTVRLVVLMVRDVSERRAIETQRDALLRRVEEAAEKQRRFLREILSSMSEGRLRLCEDASELPAPICDVPAYEPVTLDKMAIRTLRRQTIAACAAAGLPPDRESDLITAVGEAAMNAVVHAGSGMGTVYVDSESGIVQIMVSDTGAGINEESLHRATLEKGFTTAGTLGHGFWMMLKTADRVYLLTGTSGTTVVIEQERKPPVPSWMQSFVDAAR